MAVRLNPRHQEMVRAKIKTSCIIKMLMEHLEGKRELTKAQVTSAGILLNKSLSNAPTITDLNVSGGLSLEWPLPKSKLDQ